MEGIIGDNQVVLSTHNLAAGYPGAGKRPEIVVLGGLDLALPAGTMTLLVGANGSGKSTLLRTLSAAQAPLAGEVRLMGKDIRSMSYRDRAERVALVYTDRTGGGGLTVSELVALGRQPYTGFTGRLSREDRQIVEDAIEAVGIAHRADRYAATLSDGERQKAMVARALAQQTPLIILDEPTAFLDIASRLEIMQLLARLVREQKKTILLSTHDLSSSLPVADRLWVVDAQARTVIEGETERLIAEGAMDRVFPDRQVMFDASVSDYTIRRQ